MITGNYYTIDFKKLARNNIRKDRRMPYMQSVVYAAIYGVVFIYQALLKYKKAKEYQLLITPQVVYLEKMLNDRYDYTLRRIEIGEPVYYEPWYLFQEDELKPQYLYQESENQPVYLFTEEEAGQIKDDFIILVPAGLVFDEKELRSLVDIYRLAGKKYSIKIV